MAADKKIGKGDRDILIVEDSLTQAQKLSYLLEEQGYRCLMARNGKEGLEMMRAHKPAIVISDVVMPEMDGFELCKQAKSDAKLRDIPIVLLTTLSDTTDILCGLECGADNFITKPYEEEYLLNRIEYIFVNRELRKRDKMQMGVELEFAGGRHFITSERQQILDLLLSTYDQAVQINNKLKMREKELEESNARLSTLNAIGSTVSQSLNLDQILDDVLDKILEVVEIDAAGILLLEGDDLILKAHRNLPEELIDIIMVDGDLLGLIFKSDKPIVALHDPARFSSDIPSWSYTQAGKKLGFQSLTYVPLKMKGEVVGMMPICAYQQRDFTQADIELLQNIGNQIAVAVENARLYELTKSQRIKEQAALLRLSQQLLDRFDMDEIMAQTVKTARELLKADFCGIFLPDERGELFTLRACAGWDSEKLQGLQIRSEEEMVPVHVFVTKEPVSIFDASTESRFRTPSPFIESGLLSGVVMPIALGSRAIGILTVRTRERRQFSNEEVRLLSLVANQCAAALNNVRLYLAEQGRARKLEKLSIIAAEISAQHDIPTILREAVDGTIELLGALGGGFCTYDAEQQTITSVVSISPFGDYTGTVLKLGEGMVGRVALTGEPVIVDDYSQWEGRVEAFAAIRASLVATPVKRGDTLMGVLFGLDEAAPGRFSSTDLQLLKLFSNEVAIAMQNVQAEGALLEERALLARRVEERTADLSAANAELARAARLKDEFLASMSHELRTPLNAILGMSEALQEEVYGPLNEKQLKTLRAVEESGRHLLELINDILDLSKIEAGKLELEIGPISVEPICQASLMFIKQAAHKKRLKVSSALDSRVMTIQADKRRLKQILVNLLSNAVKFTPEGGTISLEVTGDLERQMIQFTVWDTGVGISQEDIGQLFQPFVQLDSSLSREHSGTGLGLALVYRMAEMHGGSVSVESEAGKGSRFTVSLPWQEPAEATGKEAPVELQTSGLLATRRVLIIEDSPTAADQLVRYLGELDIEAFIHVCEDGAIDKVLEVQPDLILLDILLPDPSGWDVLAQLKAKPRTQNIPVLIISVVDEKRRGFELGAAGYLVKPISRQQLQSALSEIFPAVGSLVNQAPQVEGTKKALILLAEDNEANINTLSDYLLVKGYRLIVARNGSEAIERAGEERPDLILMDIQMPGMDGLEATRRIRADANLEAIPIIALTALAMPGDRERCLGAGANDYLSKPVNLKGLVKAIEAQLNRNRGNRDESS